MDPIIKIENLSKLYRLGVVGTGTVSHDLNRWLHKVRGKEDPYLRIGETNVTSANDQSGYVWALKDINLEVKPGEVLGIIGKNGAGKSTLLKILSRVTGPTKGKISYRGRIGSLLEVGTGFHPEFTGRENIFLNGAILGMSKQEIKRKLNEIIDFAGVVKYIDTPVKRYSSGMKVRLGFAVAAHLEPEILVVDEVLAVGDAEFQAKALGKMQDVSQNEGRTILFVSHNMAAVRRLCSRTIVLENGMISFEGSTNDGIQHYLGNDSQRMGNLKTWKVSEAPGNAKLKLVKVWISSDNNTITNMNSFTISYEVNNNLEGVNLSTTLQIVNEENIIVSHNSFLITKNRDSKNGIYSMHWNIPGKVLNSGNYYVNLIFGENQKYHILSLENIFSFQISPLLYSNEKTGMISPGIIKLDMSPKVEFSLNV